MFNFILMQYFTALMVTGIVHFGLALVVFSKGFKKRLNQTYALYSISIAIWSIFEAFGITRHNEAFALWLWRLNHIGVIFIPIFFVHFVYILLDIQKRKLIPLSYGLGLMFLILNATPLLILEVVPKFSFRYFINPGHTYYAFFSLWVGWAVYGLIELFREFFRTSGHRRNQMKYFCWSMLAAYIGGVLNFFPTFNIEIPIVMPYGTYAIPLYAVFTAYAILKYRLMDIRVFISRTVAFVISYPFFLGIPFFFAYRMHPILYSLLGMNWWLVPSVLLIFFSGVVPLAYEQLRGKMEAALLAEQKKYQKLLLQAASGMVREHDLGKLAKLIVYIVKRIVKINFAAIFLNDKREEVYKLKAVRTSGKIRYKEVTFLYEHHFIEYLKKHKEPFLYEEMQVYLRNALREPFPISLVIPSFVEDNLLGFVFLGDKLNKQPYIEDDINVFKILSSQAALAIENCLFLEEFTHAQEKIFTAEKLASIGGMADGVAHQVKNRLNQFSVASGELKYEIKDFIKKHPELAVHDSDLKKTFKYLTEIADSLTKNIKRTDEIIKGILNFARVEEGEAFFSYFSLREIVDLSTDLLKVKHEVTQVSLDINLGSSDIIYGVKSQLTEVVYNLLDNAFEATQEKKVKLNKKKKSFEPLIELKLTRGPKIDLIEISDNGIGIRKEDKHRLFAPFFTTKSSYKSGTGIGLYVAKRIIEENHQGRLWFDSYYLRGTKFLIELPAKKQRSSKKRKTTQAKGA